MGNVFRVINSNGDIEITMYRKANAVFKTNEYNETDNICTYKETINIFNLLKENQELKSQLKGTTHCFDEEEHEKLKKQLEVGEEQYNDLIEEKESLQEQLSSNTLQLEELKEQVSKGLYNTCLPYSTGYNKAIKDKETQQKEFIEYLENEIYSFELRGTSPEYNFENVLKRILLKYKEIIGVSDENNMGK